MQNVKVTELLITEGLERKPGDYAGPGDIVAIAGMPDIMIGETLADPENPVALPLITVDEPAISMTIGTNTSPLAGRGPTKNAKVTARLVKDRLDAELVGNVSINVIPTERPDAWEVQGRGELALAILVEQMRREGFELTVGKPQVVTREINGKVHEPVERLTIDAPEEYLGTITQLLAVRKGRMEQMTNHGTGWVRMEFLVPARGLIGFRTEFLTDTRGTGIAHHVFEGYEPWAGEIRSRASGLAGGGPLRRGDVVRDDEPAGARHDVRRADHRGLRRHDRRRELPRRRHGRQHHQGEEADQRPLLHLGQLREADPAEASSPSSSAWSSAARTSASRSPPTRSGSARSSSTPTSAAGWPPRPAAADEASRRTTGPPDLIRWARRSFGVGQALGSSPTCTTSLPKLAPVSMPRNAAGAFSSPSTKSSR